MRAVNRLVSTVIALALLVATALIVIEIVAAAIGKGPAIVHWQSTTNALGRNTWRDLGAQVTGVVLVLVGLLLIVLASKRGKPDVLALSDSGSGTTVTTTRKSLQRALKATAVSTEGVEKAKVKVKRRKAVIKVNSALLDAGRVKQAVEQRGSDLIEAVGLAKPPTVRAKVTLDKTDPGA